MAKIGDIVRFLNTTGGGRITRIDGQIAYVDDDGFEVPVMLKECVVVTPAGSQAMKNSVPPQTAGAPKAAAPKPMLSTAQDSDDFKETPEGEKLNIEVAFCAADLKKLSNTTYDAFIVNDSNYWIYATFLAREDSNHGWRTLYAGLIDPGMQIFMCEIKNQDLNKMERVALQYLPFKTDKEFDLKAVACVEHKLDATKFFKLHCFTTNPYFDEPVISLPIVRNDVPYRAQTFDPKAMQRAMASKAASDRRAPRPVIAKQKADEPLVVDLHIDELVDTTAGMSNADMLNLQIDKFRQVMDQNLRLPGKRIIFIHGKGEGVLRQALMKELNYRYKGCDAQDASFREYGFGATQITIKSPRS